MSLVSMHGKNMKWAFLRLTSLILWMKDFILITCKYYLQSLVHDSDPQVTADVLLLSMS
jgi:hypothetical protein